MPVSFLAPGPDGNGARNRTVEWLTGRPLPQRGGTYVRRIGGGSRPRPTAHGLLPLATAN